MTKNHSKGQRIGRTPKTGTELAISPHRVIASRRRPFRSSGSMASAPAALCGQPRWSGSTGIRSGRCFSAPFGS